MNKQEIYEFLDKNNITYEITEHEAVFNMAEVALIDLPHKQADAKNLFVRDDKKKNYYLITVKGDKRVDLKEFKQKNNTRSLTFASEDDLFKMMNLTRGSVTPLGLLNDKDNKIIFYLDEYFITESELIGCHPNDNTATIWLKTKDLIDIVEKHGNSVNIVKI